MSYYIFLVASLAIAGLGIVIKRRSDSLGKVMMILGGIGCVGCIAWQVRQTMSTAEGEGPDRGQAIVAYVLANGVLGEVASQQGSVVLFFPPESVFDQDTVDTYAGTFRRVLHGYPALKVEVLTLAVPNKTAKAGRFTLEAFQQAAAKNPTAVAYVSFAGVPADIEKFLPNGSKPGPGFFVFDPWGTTNWLSALKAGRVRSVVVPRPDLKRAVAEVSGEPQDVFNQLYLLGTPAKAGEIAAKMGVK